MSYLFMKLRDFINLNYLDWWYLSANPSPAAVHLLEQNLDKIREEKQKEIDKNFLLRVGNPKKYIFFKSLYKME